VRAQRLAWLSFERSRGPPPGRVAFAAVLVQPAVVEPVDPFGGGKLDGVQGAPWTACSGQPGLAEPVDRLGQSVAYEPPTVLTEATMPGSGRRNHSPGLGTFRRSGSEGPCCQGMDEGRARWYGLAELRVRADTRRSGSTLAHLGVPPRCCTPPTVGYPTRARRARRSAPEPVAGPSPIIVGDRRGSSAVIFTGRVFRGSHTRTSARHRGVRHGGVEAKPATLAGSAVDRVVGQIRRFRCGTLRVQVVRVDQYGSPHSVMVPRESAVVTALVRSSTPSLA